jgi:hypothetical protein
MTYTIVVGNPANKRTIWRAMIRWRNKIKIDFRKQSVSVRTGFIGFRIETGGGLL